MKRDPIHFFDEQGVSALSRHQLEAENASLKERVEKLERLVKAQQSRLQAIDTAEPATLH